MAFVKEFREFALRGNVMDMAIGIIIGGAFGLIVKSFIDDVVMPVVGIAGKADFSNMYIPLTSAASDAIAAEEETQGVAALALADARQFGPVLAYGNFITVAINFLILAFVIFMMVKMMNNAKKKMEKEKAAEPEAPKAPPVEVALLTDIRDLLKTKA